MTHRGRFLLWASVPVIIGLLLFLVFIFRRGVLHGIGEFLLVRDRVEPADIIFLLNGDVEGRAPEAANLLRAGLAPKIVVARTPSISSRYASITDYEVETLEKLGVADSQIVQLWISPGVRHTADEADVLLDYTRKNALHRVIVVTSELHTRRARFIIRKTLQGMPVRIMMAPAPYGPYRASNWWMSEDGVVVCEEEYVKLLYYHLRY